MENYMPKERLNLRNLPNLEGMTDEAILTERETLAKEFQFYSKQANEVANRLNKIRHILRIRRLNRDGRPLVSDHALLRYLQRVRGMDIEGMRDELQTMLPRIGKGKNWKQIDCIEKDGARFYLSQDKRCITTVITDNGDIHAK